MAYASGTAAYAFLPAGGLPNPALVATAVPASDVIVCDGHGLSVGDVVRFGVEIGGSLPSPLVVETAYYVQAVVSSSRFRVSATNGGAAIDLTTAGANFSFTHELPWGDWYEWGARQVDSFLPPHVVPLVEPYPEIAITANAELAALRGLQATGGSDIDLGGRLDAIRIRLQAWAKNVPLRGVDRQTQSPNNLAIVSSTGATDPRGWATRGNDVLP